LINSNGADGFETIHNAQPTPDGIIELPVMPVSNTVVFPFLVASLHTRDALSAEAMLTVQQANQTGIVVTLRDPDAPITPENIQTIGTESAINRVIILPQSMYSALAEGRRRVEILSFTQTEPYLIARARICEDIKGTPDMIIAMEEMIINMLDEALELNDSLPDDLIDYVLAQNDAGWMADFIVTTLGAPVEIRQRVLEMLNLEERLQFVAEVFGQELSRMEINNEIAGRTHSEISRTQRELFLREQLRVIQGELGEEDIYLQEMEELRSQIETAQMPDDVRAKAMKELIRLQQTPPMAPEVSVIRSYLDWLVALPWQTRTEDNLGAYRRPKTSP
jgi:ATP-dependent Lon protease